VNAPSLHIPRNANERKPAASFLDAEPGAALLWLLLAAILAVRIVALAVSNAELFFDEAQYWAWGQEPAFGYYTKPPLIAWIIGATTSLCGDTPFCVRLPSPLMHFATSLVIYAIATKLYSRRIAFWAALLYAILPGTSLSATLMSTDVPLLLLWSLGILAIVHHVERPSLVTGIAIGVAIGLGLNAKYAMIYLPLCYAAYAVVSPKARATLRHPGTWAALAIAVLLIAPNLAWNAGHQFATFEHTRDNANWNGRFPNVLGLLAYLGTQAAIIGPVPFAAFALAAVGRVAGVDGDRRLLLLAMSLPVFLLIAVQALISKANGNWAATGFPPATVLAAAAMVVLQWRRGMIFTLALSTVLLFGISFAGSLAGRITVWPIGGELGKMVGWGDFASHVRGLADANGLKTVAFVGRGLTASMIYELRDSGLDIRSYVEDRTRPGDHFEMTRPWSPADPGPVLLVFAFEAPPPAALAGRATLVETFTTSIFVTRNSGWKASAYRIDR
jgi:4-amino-4-deoxy-L-arabinose transferase-like glycosyltransferase